MPTIRVHVDDDTFAELKRKRRAAGMPSIAAYLLDNSNFLTDAKEAQEIVHEAMKRAAKKSAGFQFRLRDLFANWDQFSKGARLRAGRLFFEKVSEAVHGIQPDGKSSSGQQKYKIAGKKE